MRVESNLAWWPFQQLRLAIQRGLTCRLYVLYFRINGIKSKLEVQQFLSLFITHTMNAYQLAVDQQQLRVAENATGTAVPSLGLE